MKTNKNNSRPMMLETLEERQHYSVVSLLTATTTILAPTGASQHHGNTIGVLANGNVVVGAYTATQGGKAGAGCVRVYSPTGTLLKTITNTTMGASDYFGDSVAITSDGKNIIIGAYGGDNGGTDAGNAFLYNGSTYALMATLKNPTPAAGDNFGCAVAAVGSNILVGASCDDTGGTDAGAAYLFNSSGTLLATYLPNVTGSKYFGNAVAGCGNNVVVADYYDNKNAARAGAVYMYATLKGTVKTPTTSIFNPTPVTDDNFGYSIAANSSNIIIGAVYDGTAATASGSAYLYTSAGVLSKTYSDPHKVASDMFGSSVAINGSRVLIGAQGDDTGASNAGIAYMFDTAGNQLYTLNNPTPGTSDSFGSAVAFSGNNAWVGAPNDDTASTDAGATYFFSTP